MVSPTSSPQNPERVGAITIDTKHDYAAYMEYCKDERNWFKRARDQIKNDRMQRFVNAHPRSTFTYNSEGVFMDDWIPITEELLSTFEEIVERDANGISST